MTWNLSNKIAPCGACHRKLRLDELDPARQVVSCPLFHALDRDALEPDHGISGGRGGKTRAGKSLAEPWNQSLVPMNRPCYHGGPEQCERQKIGSLLRRNAVSWRRPPRSGAMPDHP